MNSEELFPSLSVSHCYSEILLSFLTKSPFNVIKFQTGKIFFANFKVRKVCFEKSMKNKTSSYHERYWLDLLQEIFLILKMVLNVIEFGDKR